MCPKTVATKWIPLVCHGLSSLIRQFTTSSFEWCSLSRWQLLVSSSNKQNHTHKKKTGQSWWCLRPPAVESCYKTQYFQNIAVQRNMAVGVVPIETGRLLDVEVSPQVTHKFHYLSTWVPFTVRPCEADIFDIWSSSLSDTDENTQRHNCNTKLFLFTE